MRTINCFGDRTSGTFLIIASVSRTKITRSHGDNFVNVNVFNRVTSSCVLSYWKSKLCKKRRIWKIWNYPSPYMYLQCWPSWVTARVQFTEWHLWRQNTISLMHRDHLVVNRYFEPFVVFYTESVILGPRFILESVFFTQSVMRSLRFIPSPCFIPSP